MYQNATTSTSPADWTAFRCCQASHAHPQVRVFEARAIERHAVGGLLDRAELQERVALIRVDFARRDRPPRRCAAARLHHQLVHKLPQLHLHAPRATKLLAYDDRSSTCTGRAPRHCLQTMINLVQLASTSGTSRPSSLELLN